MFSPIIKRSLAAAAASSAWVATASTAFAEEKRTKLSIYDEPEPEVVIIESPTKLEEQVYVAQKYANETLEEGKTRVNTWVEKYQKLENDVRTNVNNTIDKNEEIFPNLLYVGVAALAGTIIARRRNVVLRFVTSTTLAVGASYYLLPRTTHNVAVHLEKLEHKYPQLKAAHESVDETVGDVRKQIDNTVAQLRGAVDSNASKIREQIQQNTEKVKEQVNQAVGSATVEVKDKLVEAKQIVEEGKQVVKESEDKAEGKFDKVKKDVESMYSTRSNPGIEETLKKGN